MTTSGAMAQSDTPPMPILYVSMWSALCVIRKKGNFSCEGLKYVWLTSNKHQHLVVNFPWPTITMEAEREKKSVLWMWPGKVGKLTWMKRPASHNGHCGHAAPFCVYFQLHSNQPSEMICVQVMFILKGRRTLAKLALQCVLSESLKRHRWVQS